MNGACKNIALVCPGGPISRELANDVTALAAAEFGGVANLHFHDQCFLEAGHFAGGDAARSDAFLEAANDPKFDAIWFARGGYGANRLRDDLWGRLNEAARDKTYLGYSDTGVILAHLYKNKLGRAVHGPMPTDLGRENGAAAVRRALEFFATGRADGFESSIDAKTPVVAFNLVVLAHMLETAAMPDLSGHVIMIEDIGEYLYRVDRAMSAITANAGIRKAAGIRLGRITDVPENDRPFGQTDEEIVQYWCARAGIPYLGRADIGHDADNKIVPFGRNGAAV
ncbi:MAG: LD-carboxypeptidase [Marinicaulis sp.]|nr:LD-carboxypeptidase [Marinicaulis sp.]